MVVKGEHVGHRQRQAQATRRQVAETARVLFAAHGYVATTIAAIAEAADIPAPTIYSAFGSKQAILNEIVRAWITAADTQRLHDEALAEPDPATRVRMIAHFQRIQLDLGLDVILCFQEAARHDPRMGHALRETLAGRERALGELIASLDGHLAVSEGEAMDRLLACTAPEIYKLLVQERGWPPDRFDAWLGELLVEQMLGDKARTLDHNSAQRGR